MDQPMNWQCTTCSNVVSERTVQPTLMPALRVGKCWRCKAKRQFTPSLLGITGRKAQGTDTGPGLLDAAPATPSGAVARRTDPSTSWDAARSISPEGLRASQQQVLQILQRHGPLTDEGIYRYVNGEQSVSGARTRRSELVEAGLVRDSGRWSTTAAGRKAIVWEAKVK